ncbi:hypothetical protein [Ruminococcus sp.]|uniref:hypothetical protein n=1 Tax=Ruminococcus sp. TaxID=41978 RepID=UPI0025FAFAD1|nr:hypothetical protein [Ruminococcus sp.]
MTNFIKLTAVFIRANVESLEALNAADALADITDCIITIDDAVSVISSLLNREFEINECVPNVATAFVVTTINALRKALHEHDFRLSYDLADILQALPDNEYLCNKEDISSFNNTYIKKFNKKYGLKLPLIV